MTRETCKPAGAGNGARESSIGTAADFDPVLKAIRRIIHSVDRRSKQVARATGLTIPQIVVLKAIRDLGEVPTNRLSAHADLSAATVITILDKLEEKGLVTRRRATEDRRIVYSQLTAHGVDVISVAPALVNDAFIAAFAKLSDHRRRGMVAALSEVASLFDIADRESAGQGVSRSAVD